jgi:transposase
MQGLGGTRSSGFFGAESPMPKTELEAAAAPRLVAHLGGAREGNSLDAVSSAESLCGGTDMDVVYECCAGLDVHKRLVVACVVTRGRRETVSFGTTTGEIVRLGDWLREQGVTHVAMESTGVYWKPIFNLLEGLDMEALVINAQHVKAIPGRKTDVKDAEWIADLLRHGLVRGSYVPSREQRELRELVRYRRSLLQQRGQVVNRIQKVLEGANIKLSSVASDITGVSGRAMLSALVDGIDDAKALASLARGVLRKKQRDLEEALAGLMGAHQRVVLKSQLRHLDFLDAEIDGLDREVEQRLNAQSDALERLDEIPGIGRRAAEEILAETGTDMSRFPSSAHLASWARLCPGNHESGGKRSNGRTGAGNPWLRRALVEAAWSAARTRRSYLASQFKRIAARRDKKRAAIAVAHSILKIIYYMLRDGTRYDDLGANYFDERQREATIRRSVQRLERLGLTVTLVPA